MNNSHPYSYAHRDPMEQLLPSLTQCFTVIFFGYMAGKFEMISPLQAKGIGTYISKFALPAIFFKVMVTVNFSSISWSFVMALSLAKVILFLLVLVFVVLTIRPTNLGYAGIATLFCTATNDMALGYPIINAMFPDYSLYVYLVAPIQLVVLSPISFLLVELDLMLSNQDATDAKKTGSKQPVIGWRLLMVMRNVFFNPLVFMTLSGAIMNFFLSHQLPIYVSKVLDILAESFTATALFFLGLGMVSKANNLSQQGIYLLVFMLSMKLIFMPFLTRECVNQLLQPDSKHSVSSASFVGFLYGVLPPAPMSYIFAMQYQLIPDIIASGLVLGTFICAPIMYVTTRLVSIDVAQTDYVNHILRDTTLTTSYISIFSVLLVLFFMFLGGTLGRLPQQITAILQLFILMCNFGLIMSVMFQKWCEDNKGSNISITVAKTFVFCVFFAGVSGTRFWTSWIAIALVLLKWKGNTYLKKCIPTLYALGFVIPLVLPVLVISIEGTPKTFDPILGFGKIEMFFATTILFFNISITLICLVVYGRLSSPATVHTFKTIAITDACSESISSDASSHDSLGFEKNDTMLDCSDDKKLIEGSNDCKEGWNPESQFNRHITLLIFLLITMFFGVTLCMWRLLHTDRSGIYMGLEFLDSVFYFGQGFIVLCIFGLEFNLIVYPLRDRLIKLIGSDKRNEMNFEDIIDPDVLATRREFLRDHYHNCRNNIVGSFRSDSNSTFSSTDDSCEQFHSKSGLNASAKAI